MKRKAGREQEAPFFMVWCERGRKSPSASPQINQKNKKASFLFFRFIGASNFINKLSRTGNQKNKERKRSYFIDLVRVEGVGPSSLPWEGNIIAVIRHSRNFILS